ncbi:MAG: 50S ribosomal protein L24 [Leptospiraceae bacterium]|nr:50S ribosomal protein L24 [Leptospiraceae bacterium]
MSRFVERVHAQERYRHRKLTLKIGDEVVVISGKEKGKRGKILHIDRANDRVYVEGVNKIKRFMRPSQENPQGGVLEIEAPMHLSNVLFYDSKKKKGVKLGKKIEDGKSVRISRPEGKTV